MKSLTESVSLRLIGGRAVEFHSEALGDSVPQLRCKLCAPVRGKMSKGVPKRATQVPINACVISTDASDVSGTASGQRVVLSTMVNRYVKP